MKRFIVLIIILAIVVVGYVVFSGKSSASEIETISDIDANWSSIESTIDVRPGHPGTTVWPKPIYYRFLGDEKVLVGFEDGYNPAAAILEVNAPHTVLASFAVNISYAGDSWQEWKQQNPNLNYEGETYQGSVFRNGQVVYFDDWTLVPEKESFNWLDSQGQ